jgi:hypothetical protein
VRTKSIQSSVKGAAASGLVSAPCLLVASQAASPLARQIPLALRAQFGMNPPSDGRNAGTPPADTIVERYIDG